MSCPDFECKKDRHSTGTTQEFVACVKKQVEASSRCLDQATHRTFFVKPYLIYCIQTSLIKIYPSLIVWWLNPNKDIIGHLIRSLPKLYFLKLVWIPFKYLSVFAEPAWWCWLRSSEYGYRFDFVRKEAYNEPKSLYNLTEHQMPMPLWPL